MIKTKHGIIKTPNFFPVIGWPAGRGEYDRLFKLLKYFSNKIDHKHFLFNFGSFAFGFTIPQKDFNTHFDKFKNKDIRNSLVENTLIDKDYSKSIIVLLDNGGNRIFNKVVASGKDPFVVENFKKYIDAYFDFVDTANVDIYVSFDIGPSYTTRDEISKQGCKIWESASNEDKAKLNDLLLMESSKRKVKGTLMMVVVSGGDIDSFRKKLIHLHSKFGKSIDYLAVGGIANQGIEFTEKILNTLREFVNKNSWNVKIHGLGMGGLKNIPLLVKYGIDTCDVATPWRRACTDAISNMYVPLFDKDLNLTSYEEALSYHNIYNPIWNKIECHCPFCEDLSIKEIVKIYRESDKRENNNNKHLDNYYNMRVRIFFHNLFQHIALLKKLNSLKKEHGDQFLEKFIEELPQNRLKKKFSTLI